MSKTQSNNNGLEQLSLFSNTKPQKIEFEGREFRRLKLLNSYYKQVDQWVNDALCKGYEPGKNDDLRFYESLEIRDAEIKKTWSFIEPELIEVKVAEYIFF